MNVDPPSPGARDVEDDAGKVLAEIRALLDQLQLDTAHDLTLDSDLSTALGLDSLAIVELCDLLERAFDVTLPDEVFLTATTPRQWLTSIRRAKATDGQSVSSPFERRDDDVGVRVGAPRSGIFTHLTREAQRHRPPRRVGTDGTKKFGPGRSGSHVVEWLHLIYSWLLLAPFALTIWTLAVLPISPTTRRDVGRRLARGLCRALGISLLLEGSLPTSDEPFLVAANHASFVDGLVLYVVVPEPLVFVTSVEIERQPFLGRIARGYDVSSSNEAAPNEVPRPSTNLSTRCTMASDWSSSPKVRSALAVAFGSFTSAPSKPQPPPTVRSSRLGFEGLATFCAPARFARTPARSASPSGHQSRRPVRTSAHEWCCATRSAPRFRRCVVSRPSAARSAYCSPCSDSSVMPVAVSIFRRSTICCTSRSLPRGRSKICVSSPMVTV